MAIDIVDTLRPRHDGDGLFRRCLAGATTAGAIFLALIMLAPLPKQIMETVTSNAPLVARIEFTHLPSPALPAPSIVRMPSPLGGVPTLPPGPRGTGSPEGTGPRGPLASRLGPGTGVPGPGGGKGTSPGLADGSAGRARAAQVASQLAGATSSLEGSLQGLTSALQASGSDAAIGGRASATGGALVRHVANVRGGRSEAEIASAGNGGGGVGLGSADLGGSAVRGSAVAIGTLSIAGGGGVGSGGYGGGGGMGSGSGGGVGTGVGMGNGGAGGGGMGGNGIAPGGGCGGTGGGPGGGGDGKIAGPGVYRSNASLMAVIQKYSAGIQFCYSNELKRHEGLKGKLVVAITVNAAGEVVNAAIVQNSLGADGLTSCALSQIRDWRFPAIPQGVTAFQVPFVFTPPN